MGEYGSLLQLGFGIGAGLSVFQAPLKLRYEYLNKAIVEQLEMTSGIQTEKSTAIHARLSTLIVALGVHNDQLNDLQKPFLILCLIGAAVNWIVLIYASMYASHNVSHLGRTLIIFISVVYYILIGLLLELFAKWRLNKITKEFSDIQHGR